MVPNAKFAPLGNWDSQHILFMAESGWPQGDSGLHKVLNKNLSVLPDLINGKRLNVDLGDYDYLGLKFSKDYRKHVADVAKEIDEIICKNILVICKIHRPSGYRQIGDYFELSFFTSPWHPSPLSINELQNLDEEFIDSIIPTFRKEQTIGFLRLEYRNERRPINLPHLTQWNASHFSIANPYETAPGLIHNFVMTMLKQDFSVLGLLFQGKKIIPKIPTDERNIRFSMDRSDTTDKLAQKIDLAVSQNLLLMGTVNFDMPKNKISIQFQTNPAIFAASNNAGSGAIVGPMPPYTSPDQKLGSCVIEIKIKK